jgi:pyruvate,water dikinase
MRILPLPQIRHEDARLVGNKALSLGELIAAHVDVPEGFVVTDEAYRGFLSANQLLASLEHELSRIQVEELHSVEYASRVIHDLILAAPMPADLEREILQQWTQLTTPRLSVRSSAYADDPYTATWVGELATFLNVDASELMQHIKQCWASLFSSRTLYQIAREEISLLDVHMGVIVQKLVPAKSSGLLYTRHPVTGDGDQLVIEAGLGLGEGLDRGQVVPDTYVVRKSDLSLIESHVVPQKSRVIPEANSSGTTLEALERAGESKLATNEIRALAKIALDLEKSFAGPVLLEWAWGERPYFLQARRLPSQSR